jgi:hypothetical protein
MVEQAETSLSNSRGAIQHQDNMIVVLAISDDNLTLGRMAA